MKFNRVLLVLNSEKPGDEKEKLVQQVMPILSPNIKELTIIQTESVDELKEACHQSVELIIVYGGDGTVHVVVNELMKIENRPKLAILPGGTCNDISRALFIPQNLKKAAESIVEPNIKTVDVASINDYFFLNFSGIGLITEASENIDDQLKETFGRISYFISAIQQLQQSESFHFKLTTDGEVVEEEAVMILVMNGYFIGTHQFPLPTISIQDGLLDVMIIKESNLQTIRDWFSLSYTHQENEEEHQIKHIKAKEVIIEPETIKDVDTDGEVYIKTPIKVKVLPEEIDMIVGENFIGEE